MLIRITAHLVALLFSAILLTVCMADGAGADDIDPKQSCGTLARVIGEGDADKVADTMQSHSRGGMDESAEAAAQQMIAYVKQLGLFNLSAFMVENEYGERYKRYWYLLLFEGGQSLYIYCAYVKPDDGWMMVDMKFNTDFEELPTP